MRVLIDECAPRALKIFLCERGHECRTVQEARWAGKENGELLTLAETGFEVFVTLDTNLRYQQNLTGRKIVIVLLLTRSNRLADLMPLFPVCAEAIDRSHPGDFIWVDKPM